MKKIENKLLFFFNKIENAILKTFQTKQKKLSILFSRAVWLSCSVYLFIFLLFEMTTKLSIAPCDFFYFAVD